jgi:tetratricopeptide (TPR) repeat protein
MVSSAETQQEQKEREELLENIEALQRMPKQRVEQTNNGPISSTSEDDIDDDDDGTRTEEQQQRNKLRRRNKRQYKRKREKPITEREADQLKEQRQAEYEELATKPATIWSFENLFPEPVWDDTSIQRDLFEVVKRDKKTTKKIEKKPAKSVSKLRSSSFGGSSMMRVWREPKVSTAAPINKAKDDEKAAMEKVFNDETILDSNANILLDGMRAANATAYAWNGTADGLLNRTVDFDMTRRVDAAVYGIRRTTVGDYQYDTSLMGEGAVQFRDGVRLGNALKVNADRLNYLARKEMAHGRNEEAQELYERAIGIDPRDGRAYLGLSRIAERRRDFKLARQCLRSGIANSISIAVDGQPDFGGNPFLIQALGCLEEKAGHLSEAEALYISAARSRPSHAAAWVALAQLRTRKLRQTAAAGRICFQTAERELKRAGLPPSAHVYTAWAALEWRKAGDIHKARELFQAALEIDPKCSAAYLQLGVMEADKENWDSAEKCFDTVLKFDKRNSRVLQAYAIMASKRPDGSSRKAIELFERALKAKPRDAGVLQAYALFVVKLGDVEAAKSL